MSSELLNIIERASKEGYIVIFGMHPVTKQLVVAVKESETEDPRFPILGVDTLDSKSEERIIDFIKRYADVESYYAGGWDD